MTGAPFGTGSREPSPAVSAVPASIPSAGFSMESLREAMKALEVIPPAPMLASWEYFPRDHALSFERDGRHYFGAHPDFWRKIPASDRGRCSSLLAIDILDFSLPYHRKDKAEFFRALASGIEARSDATPESGAAEGESPVPNGETP